MFHLNIRSIPEHFIELTSYIYSLNIAFKIIGINETWLKPFYTNYIIPNYNIDKYIRVNKHGVIAYTYTLDTNTNSEMILKLARILKPSILCL